MQRYIVRRVIASSLLLLFMSSLCVLPALATLTPNVRACCRANGRHHCSAPVEDGFLAAPHACPYAPPLIVPHSLRPQSRQGGRAVIEAHPILMEFLPGAIAPHSRESHADRGPPLASSSR